MRLYNLGPGWGRNDPPKKCQLFQAPPYHSLDLQLQTLLVDVTQNSLTGPVRIQHGSSCTSGGAMEAAKLLPILSLATRNHLRHLPSPRFFWSIPSVHCLTRKAAILVSARS